MFAGILALIVLRRLAPAVPMTGGLFVLGPPPDRPARYAWGVTDDPSEGNPLEREAPTALFTLHDDGSGETIGPAPRGLPVVVALQPPAIAANDAEVRRLNTAGGGGPGCLDFNGDGSVDSLDYFAFLLAFFAAGGPG